MNSIDRQILEHIYCEYKWGFELFPGYGCKNGKKIGRIPEGLFEEQGQIPEISKYVSGFQEFVKTKIIPHIKEGGTHVDVINNVDVFGVKTPFFTSCNIEIIATINDENPSWNSGYFDDKSWYDDNGGYVAAKVTASANDENELLSLLSTNFAHELTHAYDDYCSKNLTSAKYDSNYLLSLSTKKYGRTNDRKELGDYFYWLSPIERNAIIGQVSAEIQGKETKTPKEALSAIKQTNAYRHYIFLKEKTNALNNEKNESNKRLIIDAYVNWLNKVGKISNNITYQGFLSDINAQFKKWERKFLNSIGKIAYTKYLKEELFKMDYFDSEKKAPLKNKVFNEGFSKERTFIYEFPNLNIIDNDVS